MIVLQHGINGLIIGGVYILMALGLTLIYGVLRVLHFAHGLVVAVGAYAGWRALSVHQQPFWVALLLAMLSGAVLGLLIERLAYRPLGTTSPLVVLVAGVGVAIMGEDLLTHIALPERRPIPAPTTAVWHWRGLTITGTQVLVLAITLGLLLALGWLLRYTRLGLAMQAIAADREASVLMGVHVQRVIIWTFWIGSALAGAAGLLIALSFNAFYPTMGTFAGEKAFAVVVMGGLGSVAGTVYAGLSLGLLESLLIGYVHVPIERDAIAFLALIIFLLLRPAGFVKRVFAERG